MFTSRCILLSDCHFVSIVLISLIQDYVVESCSRATLKNVLIRNILAPEANSYSILAIWVQVALIFEKALAVAAQYHPSEYLMIQTYEFPLSQDNLGVPPIGPLSLEFRTIDAVLDDFQASLCLRVVSKTSSEARGMIVVQSMACVAAIMLHKTMADNGDTVSQERRFAAALAVVTTLDQLDLTMIEHLTPVIGVRGSLFITV